MSKVSTSITINKPVEEVYIYAASPENGPMFIPNLNENFNVSITPTQVGQKWEWRFNLSGVDLQGQAEVVGMEPNKKWELKTEGGVTSHWIYSFESEGSGTRVNLDIDYGIPESVLGKVADHVVERINQRNAEQALGNLKTILES